MSAEDLHSAANKSCDVLDQLGKDIKWEQSFITEDRITCIYVARDEDMVREHARISGFPANRIREIRNGMSPMTAEPRKEKAAHVR